MKTFWILCLVTCLVSCQHLAERQDYASDIINKVEVFRQEKGYLPKTLKPLNIYEGEDAPAYYQLQNDSTYIVWYGLDLGTSYVYHSDTKMWHKE